MEDLPDSFGSFTRILKIRSAYLQILRVDIRFRTSSGWTCSSSNSWSPCLRMICYLQRYSSVSIPLYSSGDWCKAVPESTMLFLMRFGVAFLCMLRIECIEDRMNEKFLQRWIKEKKWGEVWGEWGSAPPGLWRGDSLEINLFTVCRAGEAQRQLTSDNARWRWPEGKQKERRESQSGCSVLGYTRISSALLLSLQIAIESRSTLCNCVNDEVESFEEQIHTFIQ